MSTTPAPSPLPGTLLPCYVFDSHQQLARHVAQLIAGIIRDRAARGQRAVLGLPTGSTPVGIYRELMRLHQAKGSTFRTSSPSTSTNTYGLRPERLQSYHRWMHEHLFKLRQHSAREHPHSRRPDARRAARRLLPRVRGGDRRGRRHRPATAGHRPQWPYRLQRAVFSRATSRTRLATLDPVTRRDAASDFFSEENVPTQAITMGLGTIFDARKIVLIALGEHKADIIRETAEGPLHDRVPASYLRDHADATLLVDAAAAGKLTAVATPWLLGNDRMDRRTDQAGRAVAQRADGQGAAEARRRRFSRAQPAPAACAITARPKAWPTACSAG